jgi:hypothetical protein
MRGSQAEALLALQRLAAALWSAELLDGARTTALRVVDPSSLRVTAPDDVLQQQLALARAQTFVQLARDTVRRIEAQVADSARLCSVQHAWLFTSARGCQQRAAKANAAPGQEVETVDFSDELVGYVQVRTGRPGHQRGEAGLTFRLA